MALEYWGWPLAQTMILRDERVIYLPIAKNACSSLKTLMAELGGLPPLERREDIHVKLDTERTGLLFKDLPDAEIEAALTEPGWFRFAVVREPFDRLQSVYIEKFVKNRAVPGQWIHTAPVVARVRDVAEPGPEEMARGITFAEFLGDVLSMPPEQLDPHWRPQALSFERVAYTHLYTLGALDLLAEDLSRHLGRPALLPEKNRSRETGAAGHHVEGAAHMLPGDLPNPSQIDTDSFFDAGLRRRVEHVFAADLTLHHAVAAGMAARRAARGGAGGARPAGSGAAPGRAKAGGWSSFRRRLLGDRAAG